MQQISIYSDDYELVFTLCPFWTRTMLNMIKSCLVSRCITQSSNYQSLTVIIQVQILELAALPV